MGIKLAQALLAIIGHIHLSAGLRKGPYHQPDQITIIVDNEDLASIHGRLCSQIAAATMLQSAPMIRIPPHPVCQAAGRGGLVKWTRHYFALTPIVVGFVLHVL